MKAIVNEINQELTQFVSLSFSDKIMIGIATLLLCLFTHVLSLIVFAKIFIGV